jgi:hypothetical protein
MEGLPAAAKFRHARDGLTVHEFRATGSKTDGVGRSASRGTMAALVNGSTAQVGVKAHGLQSWGGTT